MIKKKLITTHKMMMKKTKSSRFIELDFLRGFAIIFMIIIHLMWDLAYFDIYPLNQTLQNTNVIVQVMFFTLVGICLSINYNKTKERFKKELYLHLIRRGLWIFILGMAITLATSILIPERPVLFGVLHCIGICVILSTPFLKLKKYNFPIASAMILIGIMIGMFTVENPTALHLLIGLHPADFWSHTIDYFPLFPWLGVCLLGVVIGNVLYNGNERKIKIPNISKHIPVSPIKAFSLVGKHSLVIYLVHQPIITGLLLLYISI